MKTFRLLALSLAGAAALIASTACAPGPPPGAVYVRAAPPRAQVEVIGTAPGPEFFWIPGYHRWDGRAYIWAPGRWERRPRPGAVWVAGRWVHHRNGWYWREGRWR